MPRTSGKNQPPRVWQRMLSGRRLDIADPSPLDVEVEDIAHGLARVARWNGQTTGDHAFSVAQHSLLVVDLLEQMQPAKMTPSLRLLALLHDGPEYVIGDMISPFKALLGDGYRTIEDGLATAIHLRHQLPGSASLSDRTLIKQADKVSAFLEATQLAGFGEDEAAKLFGTPPNDLASWTLTPMAAIDSEQAFLGRHRVLFADHLEALAHQTPSASAARSR